MDETCSFSNELAPGMGHVRPLHYALTLDPDLDTLLFAGQVTLSLEAPGPVEEVLLDALDLGILRCSVPGPGGPAECPFRVDPHAETLRVFLPSALSGRFLLTITYLGKINNLMRGLYESQYERAGRKERLCVTQFQESDARRMFPCMDRPGEKAVFSLEVLAAEGQGVLSNMPAREEIQEGRKRRIRFQETPPMSTYLLFLGVGTWEGIEDREGTPLRVLTVPGMSRHGRFGLSVGRRALGFCEAYFEIPYPLPKLDLLAVPDFAFGAMENWGAITFRENLLLHMPASTSKANEARIAEIVAHEIVHQWFGNLVTPSDWRFLWLNESFATYASHLAVDALFPAWEVWDRFLLEHTQVALERDAMRESSATEVPGNEHVAITVSSAPILYSKGGSILRQIHGFMGDEAFRKGLHRYLSTMAYGNAASRDLWTAFEAATDMPIPRIMKTWIEQPGFPLLDVRASGGRLFLSQERFTYLPGAPAGALWEIPLGVRFYGEDGGVVTLQRTLLTEKETSLEIPEGCATYKVNPDQEGFYRVHYRDPGALGRLFPLVRDGRLSTRDRWGLQNDVYHLARAGRCSVKDYLSFLPAFENEEAYLPLVSIAGNLLHAFLLLQGEYREEIRRLGAGLFEGVLSRMGLDPSQEEGLPRSSLRDALLFPAVFFGCKAIESFALARFEDYRRHGDLHPDLLQGVLLTGAFHGDHKTLDWLKRRADSTPSEHERIHILTAMGRFRDAGVLEEVLAYTLKRVPPRNRFVPLVSLGLNPSAQPFLREWFLRHEKALEGLHPLHLSRVLVALIPMASLNGEEEFEGPLRAFVQRTGLPGDVLGLALEKRAVNRRMRQAYSR